VNLVELHPLIRRQHLPDVEQLQRAHLVQARSNRLDLVDLPGDARFVGVRGNQARQLAEAIIARQRGASRAF
jgi:hypothetical protein